MKSIHSIYTSRLISILVVCLLPFINVYAEVPSVISYQGRINNNTGTPFNGNGYFKFAFVNQTGDTTYWSNDGSSTNSEEPGSSVLLTISDGKFSVKLGDPGLTNMTQAISESVFQNTDVYLRVWFSSDGANFEQFENDIQIVTTAFSFKAATADKATIADKVTNYDTTRVQSRVIESCPSGEMISSVNEDGTVICEVDSVGLTDEEDPTVIESVKDGVTWTELSGIPDGFSDNVDNDTVVTYSGGTGITVSGTTINVSANSIGASQIATDGVGATEIASGSISNAHIASNAAISSSKINRSRLNADLLDGLNSTAFASSSHTHADISITEYPEIVSQSTTAKTFTTSQPHTFCALTKVQLTLADSGTNRWCEVTRNADGKWTLSARTDIVTPSKPYYMICRMFCIN